MTPEEVVRAALRADLDGIAITDHDTVSNVARVKEIASPDLDVIGGVEVTTSQGHLLALNVDEPPHGTDPLSVIDSIHDQGGFAVLSHPFDTFREYYDSDLDDIATAVDAVEAVNSRCVCSSFNRQAQKFAERYGLTLTGGSDAHFPMEVGRAYTEIECPLREALRTGATRVRGRGRYLSGHVVTKVHQFTSVLEP
jgi:predicted metal-dependent phosphoesterase TrpH